jgi:hypothetical protein
MGSGASFERRDERRNDGVRRCLAAEPAEGVEGSLFGLLNEVVCA